MSRAAYRRHRRSARPPTPSASSLLAGPFARTRHRASDAVRREVQLDHLREIEREVERTGGMHGPIRKGQRKLSAKLDQITLKLERMR